MIEHLPFLLPSFVACLVLAGIHVYLGQHVLARGVIFVDLSLAQLAALGATLAVSLGHEHDSFTGEAAALLLALLGAALFSLTRSRAGQERVPQEAIIGMAYAVAASLVVLLASRLPHGHEELKRVMEGNILTVGWAKVLRSALIYAVLGAIHFALRRPFLQVTFDPEGAYAAGRRVRLIDFCFYLTFAVAITQSVPLAGVPLVFTFLVVPASAGVLLADRFAPRLAIGWAFAALGSVLGISASWMLDLPTGPAVVAALGALLAIVACLRALHRVAFTRGA